MPSKPSKRPAPHHLTRGPSYHDLERGMPSDADLDHLRELIFDSHNARAAALVGTAIIDNLLALSLLTNFDSDVNDDFTESVLYGDAGPLNNMNAKVKISYALGLISEDLKKELDILREIRNIFAHSVRNIDFDAPEIAVRITALSLAVEDPQASIIAKGGGKFAFLASVNVTVRKLIATTKENIAKKKAFREWADAQKDR